MSDIVAFLRARREEDEATARAATAGPWEWVSDGPDGDQMLVAPTVRHPYETAYSTGSTPEIVISAIGTHSEGWVCVNNEDAAHIGRWDPVRVLAEVEAKRRVLDLCAAIADTEIGRVGVESHDLAFGILDALALPAADHPDFDPAWRSVTSPVQPHQDPGDTPPDLKS